MFFLRVCMISHKCSQLLILLAFTCTLVALNKIAPLVSDDYVYSFVFDAKYYFDASFSKPLSGLRDIWDSQVAHYMSWNGRIFAHTLAQLYLLIGNDWLWSVSNVLCLLLSVYLMMRLVGADFRCETGFYFLGLSMYLLLLPQPGETFFWLTGSCNYSWSLLIILIFLYLWRSEHEWKSRKVYILLFYPIALLAGNSHEALSVSMPFCLLFYAIFCRRNLSKHQWCGIAVFILGIATNVFSPGVQVRLEYAGYEGGILNSLARFAIGTMALLSSIAENPARWLLFFVSLSVIVFHILKKRYEWHLIFGFAAWLSLAASVYAGEINARSTFGAFVYSFIFLLPYLLNLYKRIRKWKRFLLWSFLMCFTTWSLCQAAYTLWQLDLYEKGLAQEASLGNGVIYKDFPDSFNSCLWNSKYICMTYLTPQKDMIQNRAFAAYYHTSHFALGSASYWNKVPSEIDDSSSLLRENEFMRLNEQWVILRVAGSVSSSIAYVCFVPSEKLDFFRYYKRCSRGWVVGSTDFLQIVHRNNSTYILVPCSIPPASIAQEIKLVLFRGHKCERVKFPLSDRKGELQPWGKQCAVGT